MRGLPIVTGDEGTLGITDTIVQRLDDAPFNKRGVASTRIQVRAMTFESMLPLKTSCGLYKVRLSLSGEQPITRMRMPTAARPRLATSRTRGSTVRGGWSSTISSSRSSPEE
jgi:hypothetical protein